MTTVARYWRVTVMELDGVTPVIRVSSEPGGDGPYLVEPPTGDGQSIDVATGEIGIGQYSALVADHDLGAGVRVITSEMTDADGQYDKLARLTIVETSPDGAAWSTLVAGYLTGIKYPTPITVALQISDPLRGDKAHRIFVERTDNFGKVTAMIGGPIVDGSFGPIDQDYGPWRMRVTAAAAGQVTLDFRSGWTPYEPTHLDDASEIMIWSSGNISDGAQVRVNLRGAPYMQGDQAGFYFPGLIARCDPVAAGAVVLATPRSRLQGAYLTPIGLLHDNDELWLDWPGTLPAVNDDFDVLVYPREISERNPLHIIDHPVDIVTKLWDDAGIAYDATASAALKVTMGHLRLLLRITAPTTLAAFQTSLFKYFKFGFRSGPDGERVLASTRQEASSPSTEILLANLLGEPDQQPVIFAIDESSIYDAVVVEGQAFIRYLSGPKGDAERPPDDIIVRRKSPRYVLDGTDGSHEITFALEGLVETGFSKKTSPDQFSSLVMSREIFARHGRGCASTSLWVDESITDQIGAYVRVTLAHQVNGAVRGGTRIMQITQRTENPNGEGGVALELLDAGSTNQAPTVPAFTLAAGATDPKAFFTVALTNAATLDDVVGTLVRVEWGDGASAPSAGALLAIMNPATETSLAPPRVAAGTRVWVRMRAEHPDKRPSAWSLWSDVDLTDLTPPNTLTRVGNVLSWVNGEATYPVEVLFRIGAGADVSVIVLPAGSVTFDLTTYVPAVTAITASVRHRDLAPFTGVTSAATLAYTTPAAGTLSDPVAPSVGVDDYGFLVFEATAMSVPSRMEVESAVETAIGSGTPGTFALVATGEAVAGGPTRIVIASPADKKLRYFRARSVAEGMTSSGYTPTVSALPWSVPVPTFPRRGNYQFIGDDGMVNGYAAQAQNLEGTELPPATVQDDGVVLRSLVKGHSGVEARHGDTIVFPNNFQNVPIILFRGGILHEPRAKWGATGSGGESSAYGTTIPTYEDFAALDLDVSGFDVRARLKQKGTPTARSHNFAGNDLDTEGETVALTLSNAPAVDDKYTLHYAVTLDMHADDEFGGATLKVTVAIDTNADGAGWVERATRLYQVYDPPGGGSTSQTWSHEAVEVAVSDLDSTDEIRLRCKTIQEIGIGVVNSILVHAFDGSGDPASGVTYTTDAGPQFASKTPDSEDRVRIDAVAAI